MDDKSNLVSNTDHMPKPVRLITQYALCYWYVVR